jgi:hypothetical protein
MSEYRKWDESRSPQWKYLLQKEATQRRKTRREIENERRQTALENAEEKPKHTHSTKRKIREKKVRTKKYIRMGGVMREVTKENIELFQGITKDDSK